MRIYVNNLDEFFKFMEEMNLQYVVLKYHDELIKSYPKRGSKEDVDFFVEDKAIDIIKDKYKNTTKYNGIKCDFYSATNKEGFYMGYPHFPQELCINLLKNSSKLENRFYIPSQEDYLYSLLYHIVYSKAELSKYKTYLDEGYKKSKYYLILKSLCLELNINEPKTLIDMHNILAKKGYGISSDILNAYLENDFIRERKSYFYSWLKSQESGEVNMFMIRNTSLKNKFHHNILRMLKKEYKILYVKRISWLQSFFIRKYVRGGKWKGGGIPRVIVIVYDKNPIESSEEDRKTHPFVFNKRQFMKKDIRKVYKDKTGYKDRVNPIHSTDNEAEAIGHLQFFFTDEEKKTIIHKIKETRENNA